MAETATAPKFTYRFGEALHYANLVHQHQIRKATGIPYIAHLLATAVSVIEHGGDEDTAIAALLHDSIEDAGVYHFQIVERFGQRVSDLVAAVTEPKLDEAGQKLPWRFRKERYYEQLRSAPPEAVLIALADKLHNARATLHDVQTQGEAAWAIFNAPKSDQRWAYEQLLLIAISDIVHGPDDLGDEALTPTHHLAHDLLEVVQDLFRGHVRDEEDYGEEDEDA